MQQFNEDLSNNNVAYMTSMQIAKKFLAVGNVLNVMEEKQKLLIRRKNLLDYRWRNLHGILILAHKSVLQSIYKPKKLRYYYFVLSSWRNVLQNDFFIKTLFFQMKQLLLQMVSFPREINAIGLQKIQTFL